jgi:hypothetical protein
VSVSTTVPTTVQITRGQLVGLVVAAAALAAAITWLLVAVAFDSGATPTQQSTSLRGAVTPAAVASTAASEWPGRPPYPPGFRGMP